MAAKTAGVLSGSVKLPFPPSTNTLFTNLSEQRRAVIAAGMRRKGKFGMAPTRAPSKAYIEWRDDAETYLKLAMQKGEIRRFGEVPVIVSLTLFPPTSAPRDVDNYAKAVLDAIKRVGIVIDDNSRYIRELHVYWENPDDRPHVRVDIELADMTGVKPSLSAGERSALRRLKQAGGTRLVGPNHRESAAYTSLITKGYMQREPGLLDGQPQAYKVKG